MSIAEEFVAECIKTIESDAYVGSSYPFLGKERELGDLKEHVIIKSEQDK